MASLKVEWLRARPNADGSVRWYFMPHQRDRAAGWAAIRLHNDQGQPIKDELEAGAAARALGAIYNAWREGKPGFGPQMIDRLGRVVKQEKPKPGPKPTEWPTKAYRPGQIGAMVTDYITLAISPFQELGEKTQLEYRTYLRQFVEGRAEADDPPFGELQWRQLAPGPLRAWLRAHGTAYGWSGMHSLYRTIRAFFSKVRLCYGSVDHPGFVPLNENPAAKLDLGMPQPNLILWPRAAIDAFVALADERGHQSIGDAIVMMGWLGVRKQDWLDWPASVFERELLAFRQEKTSKPLVLPWRMVPALVDRVGAALERRTAATVQATTFFHDGTGRPWKDADAFRDAFNGIRDELAKSRRSFGTRYYVGLDPDDPLSLPTAKLTMRTMRHTCITLNHDAGVPRELIRAITGHEIDTIDEVLKCYAATTADQAEAALSLRLAHEAKGARS